MSEPIKSVGEQIVDMFNAALIQQGVNAEYTLEDLTIGAPVAYEPGSYDETNPEAPNTSLPVTVGTGDDLISFNLHYTRLTIAGLLAPRASTIEGTGDESSTYDLLDAINELIKYELTVDDVTDELLVDTNGIVTVLIKADPASLAVSGQGTLVVESGSAPQARVASFSEPTPPVDETANTEPASEPTADEGQGDEVADDADGEEQSQA
ncbi:hypothetical protein [Xanthomonas phage RTH11]|nr:hypothetical protein [Xanthomonas phage RTH11]